jgi:hypothetical protein
MFDNTNTNCFVVTGMTTVRGSHTHLQQFQSFLEEAYNDKLKK